MSSSQDPLLDTAALADWLGVPQATVKSWRSRGGGPPFSRIGPRAVRYDPSAVQAWIDSRREERASTFA